MSERQRIKFSLGTLMVGILSVGGMFSINVLGSKGVGWPIPIYVSERFVATDPSFESGQVEHGWWIDKTFFAADVIVAILIVAFVALSVEYLIRRREARKP